MKRIDPAAQARGNPDTAIHYDERSAGERVRGGWRLHSGTVAVTLIGALFALVLAFAPGQSALAEEQSVLDAQSVAMASPNPRRTDTVNAPVARPADVREVNALIAEGQRLEQEGKLAEALIPFYAARNQVSEADQQPLVMLLDYQISGAHWRLYEQTGHPAQLHAAIRRWEHVREVYAAQNYPVGFRGLVDYDLAGGYLALAAHEDFSANLGRAAQTLKEAQSLLQGDSVVRVQHILTARSLPYSR